MIDAPERRIKSACRADRIINAARRRYARLAPAARPAAQPHNILGLFGPVELHRLAMARRWPLSGRDLHFVTGRPPALDSRADERRAWERRHAPRARGPVPLAVVLAEVFASREVRHA